VPADDGLKVRLYGVLLNLHNEFQRLEKAARGHVQFYFTTVSAIPADGQIVFVFPGAFDASSVTAASMPTIATSYTEINGGLSVAVSGTRVTVTRLGAESAATATNAGDTHRMILYNIENPSAAGTVTMNMYTTDSVGTIEDQADSNDIGLQQTISDTAAINNASITLERVEKSASGYVDISFVSTAGGALPSEGTIRVWFPSEFAFLSGGRTATSVGSTTFDGTLTAQAPDVASNYIDLIRENGTISTVVGVIYTVRITNIQNPSASGDTSTFQILLYSTTTVTDSTSAVAQQFVGISAQVSAASALNNGAVSLQYQFRSASGYTDVVFTTVTSIPADGVLQLTFPTGFAFVSGTPTITSIKTGGTVFINGAFNTTMSGLVVTIVRSGGAATTAGATHTLRVSPVRNPSVAGATSSFGIHTRDANFAPLDQVLSGVTTTISSSGVFSFFEVSLTRRERNAVDNLLFAMTTASTIPADGKIQIVLGSNFSFALASGVDTYVVSESAFPGVATSTMGGGLIVMVSSRRTGASAVITRDGTGGAASPGTYAFSFSSVRNPATLYGNQLIPGFEMQTTANDGKVLDTTLADTISAANVTSLGALNNGVFSLSSTTTGAVVTATISFTTTTAIPANGRVIIIFPSTFGFPSGDRLMTSRSTSGFTALTIDQTTSGVAGSTLTIVVTTATSAGTSHSIDVTNIANPTVTGITPSLQMQTATAGGVTLDVVASGLSFSIAECPDNCFFRGTCVNGTCACNAGYYLENCGAVALTGYMNYATQVSYEIDWASVPATQPSQPTYTAVDVAGTVCSCDLQANKCDIRNEKICCCDPDCSANQEGMANGQGTAAAWSTPCLPQTNSSNKPMTCVDKDFLAFYNPTTGMTITQPTEVSRELCIETVNNPTDGYYYEDRGAPSASLTYSIISSGYYSFTKVAEVMRSITRNGGKYLVGDRMPTLVNGQGDYLRLSAPGPYGMCEDSYTQFMHTQWNVTCYRRVVSLSASCSTAFSSVDYLNGVQVRTVFETTSLTNTYVSLSLGNNATGVSTTPPIPGINSVTGECENALKALYFTVVHDGAGSVIDVTALVILGSVHAESDGSATLQQEFGIEFLTTANMGSSLSRIRRAGNNGYMPGKLVIAGASITASGKAAVSQETHGMVVPGPDRDGKCVGGNNVTVAFGTSMSVCCNIELTLEELRDHCLSGGDSIRRPFVYGSPMRIGKYASSDPSVLVDWLDLSPNAQSPTTDDLWSNFYGAIESARTNKIYSGLARAGLPPLWNWWWYGIGSPAYYLSRGWGRSIRDNINNRTVWDPETRTCYGIKAGIMLGFKYAYEGSFAGPSSRITHVGMEEQRASWTWNAEVANQDGTQNFPHCYATRFDEASDLVDNTLLWIDAALVHPFLTYHNDWGMRWGVVNFLGTIILLTPLLLVFYNVKAPVSFVRRLFSRTAR